MQYTRHEVERSKDIGVRGAARISVRGVPRLAACVHARTGVGGIACLPHSHTLNTVG